MDQNHPSAASPHHFGTLCSCKQWAFAWDGVTTAGNGRGASLSAAPRWKTGRPGVWNSPLGPKKDVATHKKDVDTVPATKISPQRHDRDRGAAGTERKGRDASPTMPKTEAQPLGRPEKSQVESHSLKLGTTASAPSTPTRDRGRCYLAPAGEALPPLACTQLTVKAAPWAACMQDCRRVPLCPREPGSQACLMEY